MARAIGTTEMPYVNLRGQHAAIRAELLESIAEVIDDGQFILGQKLVEFEKQFAQLCGTRYAVGVNSGTDALLLSLKCLGIGPGDEVITVPNSFIATTSSIRIMGATPVLVDVAEDYNIDPAKIVAAVTPRTRAILLVHLTGRPCALDVVLNIAAEHSLAVIEDSAQAVLAEYRGRRVGSFGSTGCFSLHPLKTLNACGDGGVVTTNSVDIYEQLMILRNIGLKTRDDCVAWSHNSRLDNLQAAILLVKLRYVERWTTRRRENALYYQKKLNDIPQIKVPKDKDSERAVYHTFVIDAECRDELQRFLSSRRIGSAIHYPVPIHLSTVGRELGYGPGSFPVAERQAKRILSLPIYPELRQEELDAVVEAIRDFYLS